MYFQCTSTQYWDSVLGTCLVSCPALFSLHSPGIVFIEVKARLSLWPTCSSIGSSLSNFPHLHFVSRQSYSSFHFLLSVVSLRMFLSISLHNSVLGNAFCRSAKDRSLKIDTDVVGYEEQAGRRMLVGSATISYLGMTDRNEFQCHLRDVDMRNRYSSDLIVI